MLYSRKKTLTDWFFDDLIIGILVTFDSVLLEIKV
jgi:hypothetical protein